MYMDNIKLFAKNEKELETLIQTIRIYSQHKRIEFSTEKCAILIMKSGRKKTGERIELPNQESAKTVGEKENYEYLGIMEENSTSEEHGIFSKPSSAAEISSKG